MGKRTTNVEILSGRDHNNILLTESKTLLECKGTTTSH